MYGGMTQWLVANAPANIVGQVPVDLRPLLQMADNQPLHFSGIDLKLALTITPHGEDDDAGNTLVNVLERFVLRDIKGEEIVNLRGRHIRTFVKQVTGWRYDDPATVVGGGQSTTRYVYLHIPFHGGPSGIAGYKEWMDCVQPIDRVRETTANVFFGTGNLNGEVTAAALYISFRTFPYRSVILGSDLRWSFIDHPDSQNVEVPQIGLAQHSVGIVNDDYNCGDYTSVSMPDFSMYSVVAREQLIFAWNAGLAESNSQRENPATPEFMPLLMMERRGSFQHAYRWPGQKAIFRTVNTNAENQEVCMLQAHDTQLCAKKLMGHAGTCFQNVRMMKPRFEKKNVMNVKGNDAALGARLAALAAQKLT